MIGKKGNIKKLSFLFIFFFVNGNIDSKVIVLDIWLVNSLIILGSDCNGFFKGKKYFILSK